jgi:hypothetical protein
VARVFVSHAGEDLALAGEVHRWLVEDGHEAFLDQDLHDGLVVGEEWEQRLHERLRWADAVVCLLTSAYLTSVWCTAELVTAQNRGGRLLPVRAEPGVDHGRRDVDQAGVVVSRLRRRRNAVRTGRGSRPIPSRGVGCRERSRARRRD